MKRKLTDVLIAAAFICLFAASVGTASAYFTTYAEASGTRTIHLGDDTTIEEDYGNWKKEIRIKNNSDSHEAVYVRALAFAGDDYQLGFSGNWTLEDDGYYHYASPVEPGGETEILTISISDIKTVDGVPEIIVGKDINVVVVYETTPAIANGTDAEGNTVYLPADWTKKVERYQESAGGEGA